MTKSIRGTKAPTRRQVDSRTPSDAGGRSGHGLAKAQPGRPARTSNSGALPAALSKLVETLPVALGDDAQMYNALLNGIIEQIGPRDIFETLWAKDIADYMWEIQRYRKLEAKLLEDKPATSGRSQGEREIRFIAESRANLKVSTWVLEQSRLTGKDRNHFWNEIEPERKRLEDEYVADALARRPIAALDQRLAEGFIMNSAEVERISRAISLSQGRLTATLKEIERHRARTNHATDRSAEEIHDAVFTDTPG